MDIRSSSADDEQIDEEVDEEELPDLID